MNFEKPLSDFSEKELHERINQVDPKYGVLLSYELLRRIEIKNAESSQKFANWSLIISVSSILIALGIGGVQIYLAKVQVNPILQEQEKNQRQAYRFCKDNKEIIADAGWPDVFGEKIPCDKVLKMLEEKF